MASARQISLLVLDDLKPHTFMTPMKRINEGQDVSRFLMTEAYRDIMTFLMLLNRAIFPSLLPGTGSSQQSINAWEIGSSKVHFPDIVLDLRKLLYALDRIIDEIPLDTGPRRFGNVSFRKWSEVVESRIVGLLQQYLPQKVLSFKHDSECDATTEIKAYLLGSFGSSQRLDYGTGHELSFLAFLGCIWKVGGFQTDTEGEEERGIVLGVIEPYLALIRRLIQTYSLEPAGSHGVWGLDDHSFLPYIFGSAQYGPPISSTDPIPTEGSHKGAPDPGDIVKPKLVEQERKKNMYFGAIGFIYDVKTGSFWEHSPTLFDISGVRAGWGKINKGMIKMYNAEVLSKFPVVQHFPFGSLFSWEQDPNYTVLQDTSIHLSHQPIKGDAGLLSSSRSSMRDLTQSRTKALRTDLTADLPDITSNTQAPWASQAARHLAVTNPIILERVGARRPHSTKQTQAQSKTVAAAEDDTASLMAPPMNAP